MVWLFRALIDNYYDACWKKTWVLYNDVCGETDGCYIMILMVTTDRCYNDVCQDNLRMLYNDVCRATDGLL